MAARRQLTPAIIRAASHDAGNRSMRAAGRQSWSEEDWNAACAEYERLAIFARIIPL